MELENHRDDALNKVKDYIDSFISNDEPKLQSKADKFCYWLKDYIRFLEYEKKFDPRRRKRYKRGEIIKANLGFNIGSEEGGLHYCVVLDKKNPLTSPVVTVVPLTSVKETTDVNNLPLGNIYLEQELFKNIAYKIKSFQEKEKKDKREWEMKLKELKNGADAGKNIKLISQLHKKLEESRKNSVNLTVLYKEISKMKKGSIALTGQITTISKIRIYNPTNSRDALSNIRLSNEKLDMIDEKIIENFTNFLQKNKKRT